jgi:hypothetical protein
LFVFAVENRRALSSFPAAEIRKTECAEGTKKQTKGKKDAVTSIEGRRLELS